MGFCSSSLLLVAFCSEHRAAFWLGFFEFKIFFLFFVIGIYVWSCFTLPRISKAAVEISAFSLNIHKNVQMETGNHGCQHCVIIVSFSCWACTSGNGARKAGFRLHRRGCFELEFSCRWQCRATTTHLFQFFIWHFFLVSTARRK